MKEYGERVQHSCAVVNPLRTVLSPCLSSQTTLASKVAARPVTSNRVGTFAPCVGVSMTTGERTESALAGVVQLKYDTFTTSAQFLASGKLKVLATAGRARLPQLPNVPTFKEVGLEPVNRMAYYGVLGPKGLPKEIVDKIYSAVKKSLGL